MVRSTKERCVFNWTGLAQLGGFCVRTFSPWNIHLVTQRDIDLETNWLAYTLFIYKEQNIIPPRSIWLWVSHLFIMYGNIGCPSHSAKRFYDLKLGENSYFPDVSTKQSLFRMIMVTHINMQTSVTDICKWKIMNKDGERVGKNVKTKRQGWFGHNKLETHNDKIKDERKKKR